MINREVCEGICATLGLTLLYAGGPVALFGIFTDSVIVAWPLDVIVWVVLGFGVACYATNRRIPTLGPAGGPCRLLPGLRTSLSQLVELTK